MRALLSGRLPLAAYRALLVNLRTIYAALEHELGLRRGELAGFGADLAALRRTPALDSDIAWLDAVVAGAPVAPQAATTAYVERLGRLGRERPMLLVAHAYVRYLGDLHGGQVLGRIVGQKLGAATAFYEFGSAPEVAGLIARFRTALDGLALDDAERALMVDEARSAFERHVALFDGLENPCAGSP